VARREGLFGGRVVGGAVRAPARLARRGLCAGAEPGGSAGTAVSQEEAVEWVKKDRRRLLHVVYRVGDLDKTIK
jgi:lactoylglutathione lyase